MTHIEKPRVTVAHFRLAPSSASSNVSFLNKVRGILFGVFTCGGLFWPKRFVESKIAQEEGIAHLLEVEAQARLLEAQAKHNDSVASIEKALAESKLTNAQAANQEIVNQALQRLLNLHDRSVDEIVESIDVIATKIRLAGGQVEIPGIRDSQSAKIDHREIAE